MQYTSHGAVIGITTRAQSFGTHGRYRASGTRHNIGFEVLDEVAKQKEVGFESLVPATQAFEEHVA